MDVSKKLLRAILAALGFVLWFGAVKDLPPSEDQIGEPVERQFTHPEIPDSPLESEESESEEPGVYGYLGETESARWNEAKWGQAKWGQTKIATYCYLTASDTPGSGRYS